jgi:hypothetical protein
MTTPTIERLADILSNTRFDEEESGRVLYTDEKCVTAVLRDLAENPPEEMVEAIGQHEPQFKRTYIALMLKAAFNAILDDRRE